MKKYVDKNALQEFTTKLTNKYHTLFSSPLKASTVAEMTDESKVYVYTGSESGYTSGNWYYYNGSAWTSGGVYNALAFETDKNLNVIDKAADGKAVGDAISTLQTSTENIVRSAIITKNKNGNPIIIYDGATEVILSKLIAEIEPTQAGSGTPSPDNIRMISGFDTLTITQTDENDSSETYSITLSDEAGTVYWGELDIIRGKLTVKGRYINLTNADWHAASNNMFWTQYNPMKKTAGGSFGYCNVYALKQGSSLNNNEIWFGNSSYSSSARIVVKDTRFSTLADFKEYLTTLSNNGTPLQVVYPLANPVTYNVDSTEIKTILGYNKFETNVKNLDLTYRCDIELYLKKVSGYEKIVLNDIEENTDISNLINDAFSVEGVKIVEVPSGNYYIGSTIYIPDNKTLILQGDYNNSTITPTVISPTQNNLTLINLGYNSHLEGGVFELGLYENIICCYIDCHKRGITYTAIQKTRINGGRGDQKGDTHIYSQTGVYIECDYADGEQYEYTGKTDDQGNPLIKFGYLMWCKFDIYINCVGYGYHFHRVNPTMTVIINNEETKRGTWITESDIYGYIYHCLRYIWYDFSDNWDANNDSIIGATLQSGAVFGNEPIYPGINIWGKGIVITGKLWDFTSGHQRPAIYFEQGARTNLVTRECTIQDYALTNRLLITNVTLQTLSRMTGYRQLKVSLYSNENFDAGDYISDLTNKSYRIGDTIYLYLQFKVTQTIPKNSILFTITDDAFLNSYVFPIEKMEDGTQLGKVRILAASPHNVVAATQIAANNAWAGIVGTVLSNRITTFTM